MDTKQILQKTVEIMKAGNENLLHDFIFSTLNKYRDETVEVLKALIQRVDGRPRLKLVEAMVHDGGKDLPPLVAQAILQERNKLFAKSQLQLMGEFSTYEAVEALHGIENKVPQDLKHTLQRVLAKLSGKFREQFYIKEFKSGQPKRIRAAAESMIKAPKPIYNKFLVEAVLEKDPMVRGEAARVLSEIGLAPALEALFKLKEVVRLQILKADHLARIHKDITEKRIVSAQTMQARLCEAMVLDEKAYAEWREELDRPLDRTIIPRIIGALDIFADYLRRDLYLVLETTLSDAPPQSNDMNRLKLSLDNYQKHLREFLRQIMLWIGKIGQRIEDTSLMARVKESLPKDDPDYDALIVAVLGGYHLPGSEQLLVAYVDSNQDPQLLDQILDSLEYYKLDSLPKGVARLAGDPDNSLLRKKALNLIGKWRQEDAIVPKLLQHPSLIVRAETMEMIAEYQLDAFQHDLIDLLDDEDAPRSLIESAVTALAAFPSQETGEAVAPFMKLPNPYNLRQAALATLFEAGGANRFGLIIDDIMTYPVRNRAEMVQSFLNVMGKAETHDYEAEFLKHVDFWMGALELDQPKIRMAILELLEQFSWRDKPLGQIWITGINKLLRNPTGPTRPSLEERKMRVLIHVIERKGENPDGDHPQFQSNDDHRQLADLLKSYKSTNQYQQIQAIKNLNMAFKHKMIEGNPEGTEELIRVILDFFDRNEGAIEMNELAINLSAKIGHPKLRDRIKQFLKSDSEKLVIAAKKAAAGVPEIAEQDGKVHSIFILDDSRYITKQLNRVLNSAGFEARGETRVREGIKALMETPYDLLIVDLIMPEMNGWEVVQLGRAKNFMPPCVLVITSSRNEEEHKRMFNIGVDGLLLKPFPMKTLIDQIKGLNTGR